MMEGSVQCLHTSCGLGPDKRGSILLHLRRGRVDPGPVPVQGVPTEDMLQMEAFLHRSNPSVCITIFPAHRSDASVLLSANNVNDCQALY